MFGSRSLEQKLREGNGKSAKATVLTFDRTRSVFSSSWKLNDQGGTDYYHVSLSVEPDGEERFDAEVAVNPGAVDGVQSSELGRLKPGATTWVLYDPDDHSKVTFDSVRVAAGYAEKLQQRQSLRAQGFNAMVGGVPVRLGAPEQRESAAPPPPPPRVPAGWYPDPDNGQLQRYWDGTTWTGHTAPLV